MVNSCAVCGCCTRTDIVREHLEDTLRICDVSAKGLYTQPWSITKSSILIGYSTGEGHFHKDKQSACELKLLIHNIFFTFLGPLSVLIQYTPVLASGILSSMDEQSLAGSK